jgi:hypothetical protein
VPATTEQQKGRFATKSEVRVFSHQQNKPIFSYPESPSRPRAYSAVCRDDHGRFMGCSVSNDVLND